MPTPIETISKLLPASFRNPYERWACDTRWIFVLGPKLKNWWIFVLNSQGLLARGRLHTFKYRNGLNVLFRARTSDVLINVEVFGFDCYSEPFLSGASAMRRCIDLGAQTGAFSLLALSMNKEMEVVCVEAVTENFELLQQNLALNNFTSCAELHHKAVWSVTGDQVTLHLAEHNTGGHSVSAETTGPVLRTEVVTTISLRDLVQNKPCDVLKIDIEGAEYEVLLKTDKETLSCIANIVGEVHGAQEKRDELLEFLRHNGFEVSSQDTTFWARRIGS